MSGMFKGCHTLNELNLSNFNTNNVNNMSYMFSECSSLKNLNIINFKKNHYIDMYEMLFNCSALEELVISRTFYNKAKNYKNTFLPNRSKLKMKE